jgi:acetyl esterase/lipase
MLCLHGGGFRAGSRQGYDTLCRRLAQKGYVAVTEDYRLAPNEGPLRRADDYEGVRKRVAASSQYGRTTYATSVPERSRLAYLRFASRLN